MLQSIQTTTVSGQHTGDSVCTMFHSHSARPSLFAERWGTFAWMGQRELCKCLLILQYYSICSCFINLINLYHVVVVIYWKCFCLVLFFFSCLFFFVEGCLSPFTCHRKSQLITCITTTNSMLLALLTTQTTLQTRGRILGIFPSYIGPFIFQQSIFLCHMWMVRMCRLKIRQFCRYLLLSLLPLLSFARTLYI